MTNALFNQAKEAEGLEDQSKADEGGNFEREILPVGYTPARFIGYVELGTRPQKPYQGKEKPDAPMVRLTFELNGPKHQRVIGEGNDAKTVTNRIAFSIKKSMNEKAGFYKLLKKMAYGRPIEHMSHMLGDGFLIQIVHDKNEETGKVYAGMKDSDYNYLIQAPRHVDPITNEGVDIPVPEITQEGQLLLWDAPTKEQWDSLFIDGTRTVKDEKGNEREVSKNWLQESIVSEAKNFAGSPLEALLAGVSDIDLSKAEVPAEGNASADAAPDTPVDTTASADTAVTAESEKSTEDAPRDPLADLGLA